MTNALPSPITLAIDGALAAVLVVSLGLVFILERSPAKDPTVLIEDPKPQIVAPTKIKSLRLAVTPEEAEFDDVGRLLDTLGTAYSYRKMPFDNLLEPEKVIHFDIIFITCSGVPETWLGPALGGQLRGAELRSSNEETFGRAKDCLRQFVNNGGTLYASDLHFNLVAHCFPEFIDRALLARGAAQTVSAEVVDAGLSEMIGPEIELTFDQSAWAAGAFSGQGVKIFLQGNFKSEDGEQKTAPLLVKFPHGNGNVIFTSFHNEKQTSEKEKQLLKYLVFSAVTAGVDAEADRSMAKGGFSPTKKNLFSASSEADSVSQAYENKAVADLQFVLAFPEQGATLELAVTSPDGTISRKRGTSTITIDVPNALVGSWKYSIIAVKVPSENFPFTITVGKKQ